VTTSSGDIGEFLTVAEVAELLKLNQQTVRNWIDQGSLPAMKVGRRVRIRRADLERMLEQGYVKGGGSAGGRTGASAEAFWGGEPVGLAEPARGEPTGRAAEEGTGGETGGSPAPADDAAAPSTEGDR
jgi:excisionase family DNA binding protein